MIGLASGSKKLTMRSRNDARAGDDLLRLIHELGRHLYGVRQPLLHLLDRLASFILELLDGVRRLADDLFGRLDDGLGDLVDFFPTPAGTTAKHLGDEQDFLFDFGGTIGL